MGKKKRPGYYSNGYYNEHMRWQPREQYYDSIAPVVPPTNNNNNTSPASIQQQYPTSSSSTTTTATATAAETATATAAGTTTTTETATTELNNAPNSDNSNSSNSDSTTKYAGVSPVLLELCGRDTECNLPVVAEFKSSKKFYLNNEDNAFQERAAQISKGRANLSPYDLATKQTVSQLRDIIFTDLVLGAKTIFSKTNPHKRINREKQRAYYNWVIVDLCRRMDLIQKRIIRRHGSRRLDLEMRSMIENLFDDLSISGPTSQHHGKTKSSVYAAIIQDGEYVDFFTPFVEYKRLQVLDVVEQFGDEICLFTEFIDMKQIGDMDQEEYQDFVHDLNLCKNALKPRIEKLRFVFDKSSPVAAFNKMTLLNPDEESK